MLKKKKIRIAFIIIGVVLVIFLKPILSGISFFYEVTFNKEINLKKKDGPINVLVLGIGGGKHDGPELTDTIIYAHINPQANTVQLFSIPRDLWIPELGAKINTAYPVGQNKNKKGILLARAVIEKVTGQPVDYVTVIDFSGFVKVVDYMGGIDVNVKHTLDDFEYPIAGEENNLCGHTEKEVPLLATAAAELEAFPCRYKHIHFDQGEYHMNGENALEYVRSRHAKGAQGTDFARSERQHEVIQALKKKTFSLGILLNPVKVFGIYNIIQGNIDTDIKSSEYDDFIKLARKMENAVITSTVINTDDDEEEAFGLLTNPSPSQEFKYQWVLVPRHYSSDFSEIHTYIECIQRGDMCSVDKNSIQVSKSQ